MIFLLRKRHRITTSRSLKVHRRLETIRSILKSSRLDALLVTDIINVRYLTGFSGSNGICIITSKKQVFITDRRYTVQASQEVKGFDIIVAKQDVFVSIAEKKILPANMRVGFESRNLSVDQLKSIRKVLPGINFTARKDIFDTVTAVKDDEEVDLIKYAAHITDKVYDKIVNIIRPGVREFDISAEISYWHRKYGAECDAFDPIVASGIRSALPHARASEKKIERGDMVVLDFGCRYLGYHSDMTRTIAVGKPPAEMKKIYNIVLEAQMKAIDSARSGVSARSIDETARKYIRDKGYGRYFTHSLGHGLGVRIHEPLRLSMYSKAVLQAGNVVTVEPGIYIPRSGGVRIEDDIVIRDSFCDILTKTSKELTIV